jgi:hypothetical protein
MVSFLFAILDLPTLNRSFFPVTDFQSSVFEPHQSNILSTSGISPSFVFLQLYHSGKFGVKEKPILIPDNHKKFINLMDLIIPYELHNIGVLYVGKLSINNFNEKI